MKIEQIYTGCLAQGAYYIESEGEVAIIDPIREVDTYLEKAHQNKSTIKYIFETHFHADFVSGHLTLSQKTGAPIIFGPQAKTTFKSISAFDGQEFSLGKITLIALHTPGHTIESTCYLLRDENGKDHALFSGDTLFLGDVGRPDLAQKAANMTQEELAELLFDSLNYKIKPLADDVIVYPAHGAGSACGKNLSKETVGTIGGQKKTNYALDSNLTKDEFVTKLTTGLLPPPEYFPLNVMLNREGYSDVNQVIKRGAKALSPDQFEELANQTNAVILDVRHQNEFVLGFIPQSIFIGLDGGFAPWVGAIIGDVNQPLLLITPEEREEETITRLARVGFDHALGYLSGGFEAWKKSEKEFDQMDSVDVKQFMDDSSKSQVYDVRKPLEFDSEHIVGALNTPLDLINNHIDEFPTQQAFYIHCAGGYRSVIAGSILKSRGFHHLINIEGGFKALKNANLEVSEYICPSTL